MNSTSKINSISLSQPVSEIMHSNLITISEDTALLEIQEIFKNNAIHHILVERKIGELIGIISTEDIANASNFPMSEEEVFAYHFMTVNIKTASIDTSIKDIIYLFLNNKFRAIPIINQDEVLVGIVTPYDIMTFVLDLVKDD